MNNYDVVKASFVKSSGVRGVLTAGKHLSRLAGSRAAQSFAGRAFRSGLLRAGGTQLDYLSKPLLGVSRLGLKHAKNPAAQKFFQGMRNTGLRMGIRNKVLTHNAKNLMGPGYWGGGLNPVNTMRNMAGDWVNQSMLWAPLYGMGASGIYGAATGNKLELPEAPNWYRTASDIYTAPLSLSHPFWAVIGASRFLPQGKQE